MVSPDTDSSDFHLCVNSIKTLKTVDRGMAWFCGVNHWPRRKLENFCKSQKIKKDIWQMV